MTRRQSGLILIAISLLATLPFWFGKFYVVGDMRDVTVPLELFFQQEVRAGRLPLWNPDVAMGYPVMASAQIGFWYPPLFIARLLLPITVYLPLIWWLHVVAAGLGMLYLLQRYKVSPLSALFGASVFMLSSFIWQHATHLNIIIAIAFVPWQLLAVDWYTKQAKCTTKTIALGILLFGVPLLAGQFQIQALTGLVCGAYALITRRQYHPLSVRYCTPLIIVAIGSFLIAAIQLLPTMELIKYSSRGQGGQFNIQTANQHSFPFYHIPTFVFPHFFGTDNTYWGKRLEIEYGVFLGTIPLLLAIQYVITRWRHLTRQIKLFVWLGILSALLSLGQYSPFRLIGIEPSLWLFSAPARWLLFTAISLSILAAHALEETQGRISKKSLNTLLVLLIITLGLANILLLTPLEAIKETAQALYPSLQERLTSADKLDVLYASAKATSVSFHSWYTYLPLLALTIWWGAPRNISRPALLIIVTIVECIAIATTTPPLVTWKQILTPPAVLRSLPETITTNQARIYQVRDGGDVGAYFTDPRTRASTTIRALQRELLLALMPSQFGVASIEWPASLDFQDVRRIIERERGENPNSIQSLAGLAKLSVGAIVVPNNLVTPDHGQAYASTDQVSIFTLPSAPRAEIRTGNGQHQRVVYTNPTPTTGIATINTSTEGSLIIRDTFFPGWYARFNGQEIPVARGDSIFRQILIPAGQYTVELTYKPTMHIIGAILTSMTVLICSAMLILPTRKK